ncbi:hypothetical protein P171DRAFT_410088 [Karstenula rhodostoma CBS 690.94]|uniref:DH domain-containing protein n=1 Tax=Karstenula rhodostoma CBS 690.94 TaxID=1392251 RepID=A0A9P4UDF2_9PLEO|nr:hypothetical protein P171DRAFT_410088 [Karstenula rhodostoma CBS 690.94]
MDPISGAIGMLAAIPQCIEAAKQLYDLRERFDQAAVLITAIYTESMVVAASLSQIQSLLQGTTLQRKAELRNTLDRALTGCWVVYQCLDEEVRDLAEKVDVNDLQERDRARFLVKEANFEELLQQIRGQQSALGLLVQGLQMESLSEMHRLINDNSAKLDQIAKRSNSLRQKHPNIKAPQSVLDKDSTDDMQTVFDGAEFTFDDEIVNSKPYQRAMARALAWGSEDERKKDVKVIEENPDYQYIALDAQVDDHQVLDENTADIKPLSLRIDDAIGSNNDEPPPGEVMKAPETENVHADILDDLDKSMLPFMPPASTSRRPSLTVAENESTEASQERPISLMAGNRNSDPPEVPLTEEPEGIRGSSDTQDPGLTLSQRSLEATDEDQEDEKPPPLPPRRNASSLPAPANPEPKKMSSWDEVFAPLSTTSASPLTNPRLEDNASQPSNNDMRKSPPLLAKKSSNLSSPGTDPKNIASLTSSGETDPRRIWASILLDEENYIERMNKFTNVFYGVVVKEWPILEKHMDAIVLARQLPSLHQKYILDVVKEQTTRNASTVCDPRLFTTWANKTYRVLKEYSRRYPHALYAIRLTQTRDKKFGPCIETIGLNLTQVGQSWEDHLALPIVQLDTYITKLQGIAQWLDESSTYVPTKEQSRVKAILETLQRLKAQCSDLTEKSISQEEIQSLHRRVHTVDTSLVDVLELTTPDRRIVYQGPLALKLNSRGPWQPMQVVLLDNYFFWGKAKSTKDPNHKGMKADSIRVIEKPVSVTQISIRLPVDPVQTRKSSYLDELPRGVTLYEIFIDVVVTQSKSRTHTLGAFSAAERDTWYQKLSEVASTSPPQIPV